MRLRLFILSILSAPPVLAAGADWPGWRGPQAHGVSIERDLPLSWTARSHVAWTVEPPGKGASSPVVIAGRLYLTAQTEDESLRVLAYDPVKGSLLWDQKVGAGRVKTHELINMAAPTAAADEKHVWVLFGTGLLACLDRDGKEVWQRDLTRVHGAFNTLWGLGTSPILHDGKLFLAILQQGTSYVLAVDSRTGMDLWKTLRELGALKEGRDSYSSPTLATVDGRSQIVVSGGDHLDAYDPDTGERLWVAGGLDVPHPYGRTIASPTAAGDFVLTVASGYQNQGRLMAMRARGKGTDTLQERLWINSRYSPDCPSPVIYYGLAFTVRDDGIAQCLDLRTGVSYWQERVFAENSKVSPVAGDGRIYFVSGRGNCVVVKAAKEFEVLSRNELNEDTLAAPAIADGRFYLRTARALYAFGRE
jgi:outer membrane protein assembly factor BamB